MSSPDAPADFTPPAGLSNPHLQTLLPFLLRQQQLKVRWQTRSLPDGDSQHLAWYGPQHGPILILLHGLGGCVHAHYLTGIQRCAAAAGWRCCTMHLRGCGPHLNRHPRLYHAGDSADLADLVRWLKVTQQPEKMVAVGCSLGASLLLKYLAECAPDPILECAIAISTPFDLQACVRHLQRGVSRIYTAYMLRGLKQLLRRKLAQQSLPINPPPLHCIRSIEQFDHHITAALHGFASASDYYQRNSCGPLLQRITTPTHLIQAVDDPFIPPETLPAQNQLSNSIVLHQSPHGGHLGFMQGMPVSWWLDRAVCQLLPGC